MIPVQQTILSTADQPGNCLSACVASILEVPLEEVPLFAAEGDWLGALAGWCAARGWLVCLALHHYGWPADYHIRTGPSPRRGNHAVVGRGAEIVHDPHPDGGGLAGPAQQVIVLVRADRGGIV